MAGFLFVSTSESVRLPPEVRTGFAFPALVQSGRFSFLLAPGFSPVILGVARHGTVSNGFHP
jgi:hypothetical protein